METRRDLERATPGSPGGRRADQRRGCGRVAATRSPKRAPGLGRKRRSNASLVRLFPKFSMADDPRWSTVVEHARQGAADALSALGYHGNPDAHPVCKEMQGYLGAAGKLGQRRPRPFHRARLGLAEGRRRRRALRAGCRRAGRGAGQGRQGRDRQGNPAGADRRHHVP